MSGKRPGEVILTRMSDIVPRQLLIDETKNLKTELDEWHKLRDPVNLHVNLLRGIPAKLTREQFLHLAGADQLREENQRLRAGIEAVREANRNAGPQMLTVEQEDAWSNLVVMMIVGGPK